MTHAATDITEVATNEELDLLWNVRCPVHT